MHNKMYRGLSAPQRVIALIIATLSVTLLMSGCSVSISEDDNYKSSSEISLSYDELMTIIAKQCIIIEQQISLYGFNGSTITVTPEMYNEIDVTDFDYSKISFEDGQVYYYASDGHTYCITPTTEEDVPYEK